MTFEPSNMRNPGSGFFTYETDDTLKDCRAADYFKRFVGGFQFKVGDAILVASSTDGESDQMSVTALNSDGDATAGPFGTVQATELGTEVAVDGLTTTVVQVGEQVWQLQFVMDAMEMAVDDEGVTGAFAFQKLFDFAAIAFMVLGVRQTYTAFETVFFDINEGESGADVPGDATAAFKMALGTVAANVGDGVLTGTEVDIGAATNTITLVAGTATGGKVSGVVGPFDGQGGAIDMYLNWCGTALSITATDRIRITGDITVTVLKL